MTKEVYCNIKITAQIKSPQSDLSKSEFKSLVSALNIPGLLQTKAHLRRGRFFTIATDVATPDALALYFKLFAQEEEEED